MGIYFITWGVTKIIPSLCTEIKDAEKRFIWL